MQEYQIAEEVTALELIENLTERAWAEIEEKIMYDLKTFIEEPLEEELTQRLRADSYERTEERKGYWGSHYQRGLATRFGHLEDLRVPRPAQGPVPFTLFDRYERRRWDVDAVIGRLFLLGVSTRKIKGVAKDIFGIPVSAQTVSKTTDFLEEELKYYQERELSDDVEFLFLDGLSEKVREIGVEKKVFPCAFGIHEGGEKEILFFRMADPEDLLSWKESLADLQARVFSGNRIRLILSDSNPALLKAVAEIYPFRKVQRCIAHKMRNVTIKLKKHNQKPATGEARLIFSAPNKKKALGSVKFTVSSP